MQKTPIVIIVGSLRKKSLNAGLARAIVAAAPKNWAVEIPDISSIPLYNGDVEASAFPPMVTELKNKIKAAGGIIVVTPEYNRSMPGVLKNVIDWTSRPYGDSAWKQKPVAVTGASGRLGTALAQYHLKQVLAYLDTYIMGQPELYVDVTGAIDADSNITDEKIKGHISAFVQKFDEDVKRFQK